MIKLRRILYVVVLFIPTLTSAEYNSTKLAVAVGKYLGAVSLFEYLQSSQCGYLIGTNFSLDQASRDALLNFRIKDREEMETALKQHKPEMIYESKEMVDGALKAARKDGLDLKSACGMLVGTLSSTFSTIRSDYKKAISTYSK